MANFRLRYEEGRFVPLDPMPDLEEGQEIEVTAWRTAPAEETLTNMLERTRGLWADWSDIEDYFADTHQQRD